jgi:alpha-tubulin suppressor-like RCC1 family protein
VLADGTARCWGWGLTGQLGNGGSLNSRVPVVVSGLADAVAVSTGDAHSCALRSNGTVRCWGLKSYGNVGVVGSVDTRSPVDVPSVQDAVAVSAGGRHTCALIADGTIRCWGRNLEGQLGQGYVSTTSVDQATGTVQALTVRGITDAVSVSAGTDHTCAVLADGSTRCWGSNQYGQIGDGSRTDAASPVTIAEAGSTAAVSAGERHSCAVATDGATRCWGRNDNRQLGTGASWTSAPVQVVGIT